MSSSNFAYRRLLQELTNVTNSAELDPYETYGWFYEQQALYGLRGEAYLSSSITSGGHARDNSLEMKEIIARNTESARLLAEQLARDRQIRAAHAIEPVFVGKTHWDQAQFMEFWLCVIGGYKLTKGFTARDVDNLRATASQRFDKAGLDRELMVSKASPQVRAAEYFKMSGALASLITEGAEANPIDTVVRMIDTDMSLGSQTERIFARQIGTSVMNISVVKPATVEDLTVVNHQLYEDTARLIRFGATVFDTQNNDVRLMLVEDAA